MTVYLRWAVLGLTLILAACAGGPGTGKSQAGAEDALERRVVERWNLLIAGDYTGAYDYFTPGYRSTRTAEAFAASAKPAIMTWRSIEWRGANCETPDSCLVSLLLSYSVQIAGAGTVPAITEVKERWMRIGGDWHHLPQQ